MKKNKYILLLALSATFLLSNCTNLDEEQLSQLRSNEYPSIENPLTFKLLVLESVVHLRQFTGNQRYWLMLEGGTDECVIPTRGSGWGDGNQWRDLHKHEWTKAHPKFKDMWNWAYAGVAMTNRGLFKLKVLEDSPVKANYQGQIRAMRALYYFLLMDSFGNIPLVTSFEDASAPSTKKRAEVFSFLESELKEISKDIAPDVNPGTYGLPTKWFAHFLLSKLYLNAEVYAGKNEYAKALEQLDIIIDGGKYQLATNYLSTFLPTNGPQDKETIFTIVNEANAQGQLNFQIRFLPGGSPRAFGVKAGGWGGHATLPEFYNMFKDPTDQRNKQWLVGKIAEPDGTPIMNGTSQMDIINELRWGIADPANPFNVGGDQSTENGTVQGVRSVKYRPDPNFATGQQFMNNDYVMFRYADVILMKAEALLRLGQGDPLALVNTLRATRTAKPRTALTLDDLLEERGLEFAYEHWRRNDLIRFGKWEGSWGLKTNSDPTRRLFPIPQDVLAVNPNLVQNPGYPQ